ncbi:terminase large subunit [Xanthomonas phage pXoo2107]|nr:terminase large subunit [Xanthomonas phage pXoo2107]
MTLDPVQALILAARTNYAAYVSLVHRPRFIHSPFSYAVCAAIDQFVLDVLEGKRPVLALTAPPQHGKSSLISRCLPPYLLGRLGPHLGRANIVCASYGLVRAAANLRDAKSILFDPAHRAVFPASSLIDFKGGVQRADETTTPAGDLYAVGVRGPLTGKSIHVGLIDDGVKGAQDALSSTVQDALEAWYDSEFTNRLQQYNGRIIMGTPWSAHDLLSRVHKKHQTQANYRRLQFVALNEPGEIGYDPSHSEGALIPALHSREQLLEFKSTMSESWWAAMYQQAPMSEMGAIFGKGGVRYYRQGELPTAFAQVIMTVDASFKGKETSDFCAIGVWAKTSDNRVWLLAMRREKLAFTATAQAIVDLKAAYPQCTRIYIEDAANGPALIEMLSRHVQGIVGVPALGSKESRWHAVAGVWQSGQVMLPHPDDVPSIVPVVAEIVAAPDVRNDDAVDCMAMALYQLCMRNPISSMITQDILRLAAAGY